MADPEVVTAILGVLHDGFRIVPADVLRRASLDDFEAVRSLLLTEEEMGRADVSRELREFAAAARAFLDSHPAWGT